MITHHCQQSPNSIAQTHPCVMDKRCIHALFAQTDMALGHQKEEEEVLLTAYNK